MTAVDWVIPPSTLRWLDDIPRDRPVAMLIRHSVRDFLPPGDAGYDLPITDVGHRLAVELGRRLAGRLRSVHASPLVRTVQTATRLAEGASLDGEVVEDRNLGDPGAFVVDERAGATWASLGHEEVMRRLGHGSELLPGCADADAAARFLVQHMLRCSRGQAGVHAFVTHDSLVTATAARFLGAVLTRSDWPWYLEAAFFWEDQGAVQLAYRERRGWRPTPLMGLTEADVIFLARHEVAATVGLDCPARFFLAGGAFKSLLTGRPPRDLDLWAPSSEERAVLETRLIERGAERLPERPYTQGFRLNGRVVELPRHTEPATLEERLLRFDLGLSAIGAEHAPHDRWRAVIHPLAQASVERRQILLLDELHNWRHCLTSLERLRRYARELGFEAPPAEEGRIWAIYDAQPPDVRRGMVERFHLSARHDQGVAEEVAWRCR